MFLIGAFLRKVFRLVPYILGRQTFVFRAAQLSMVHSWALPLADDVCHYVLQDGIDDSGQPGYSGRGPRRVSNFETSDIRRKRVLTDAATYLLRGRLTLLLDRVQSAAAMCSLRSLFMRFACLYAT